MTRPLTADDLYALALVEDPQMSPDGSLIAFVRMEIERATYTYRRSIYVAPAQGGEPRRLTNGPADTAPRWSPDGATLAFLRGPGEGAPQPKHAEERERGIDKRQLWLLPMAGGEPRQVTQLRHGAGVAVWSPDGATLAFSAQTGTPDDAQVDDEALAGKKLPRVRTITNLWHRLDGEGFIYELRAHIFTVAVAGGAPRQLTDGDWNDGAVAWSPDGATLAFTSDRSAERWVWPGGALWIMPATGGEPTRLTDEALNVSAPAWAPDGQTLAFLAAPRRHGVGHTDLYIAAVHDARPGMERSLTDAFTPTCADSCIDDQRASHLGARLTWSADGAHIYFLGSYRGATYLYAAQASGGEEPRPLTEGQRRVYDYNFDTTRRHVALAVSNPVTPGDLFTCAVTDAALGEMRQVTHINAAFLAEVELARPEEISFNGADGWQIQGWVMRPVHAQPATRLPTVLEIHGGPAAMYGESFFFEFQLLAARGYAVVYSNPRGSTGYGRMFSAAVLDDWGGKDYQDIMAGLDAAIARGGIDAQRLGVAGGSYGGFMTNWVVSHTDRFKAAVTMRCVANMATMFGTSDIGWELTLDEMNGATPWEQLEHLMRMSPITYVAQITTPLLILHSDNDLRCPITEGEQMFSALKYLGRETKMVRFEGQSHDLSRNGHPRSRVMRLNEIVGWFEHYLPTGDIVPAASERQAITEF